MEEKLYPRRWAILAALFLCLVTLQFSFIVPGGAALAVMMRYGIDDVRLFNSADLRFLEQFR